jgi:6-pyruvoyltetrahydropterin/6-carboxytetrahydropterin synthase
MVHVKNLHGHEWKLEVSVIGLTNPKTNMIIDFKELKMIVNEKVINLLDRSYLNDLIPYPMAENIIDWIWDQLWSELNTVAIKNENYYFKLNKLTLYETKDSYITRSA